MCIRDRLSPVHGVGLVSVPTLGPVHVRQKVQETTVHVVGQLLGYDAEDRNAQRDLARRAHQLSTDLDERPDDNVVQFTARVLSGNVRLLLGMIRANQPWAFVARLSRALVVAAATGMLTLVASDPVSYTHLRAHETVLDLVCRLLLEKKNKTPHTQE